MWRRRTPAFLLLTMLVIGDRAARTAEPLPRVPARLIPKGWELFDEITGDLNRDGRPDLILQLARLDENKILNEKPDEQVPRRLVVAFREGQDYRQIVTDDGVLSTASQASAANVSTELKVERGSLVLTQMGGRGNSHWTMVNRYRWDGRGLAQIGFTCEGYGLYGEVDHFHHKVFDTNLLTSQIEETQFRWRVDEHRQSPGTPRKLRYRLVPIVSTTALPSSPSAPLSSRVVKLSDRADVIVGGDRWRGASDLSATLSAALSGQGDQARLYVRALVHDSSGGDMGEVRLLSAGGKLVRPERIERSLVPGGYTWQAQYLPAALKLRYGVTAIDTAGKIQGRGWGIPGLDDQTLDETFPATLEVISRSPSGGERLVLSTARSRKRPGLCWLHTAKLPCLGVSTELPFFYQPPDF